MSHIDPNASEFLQTAETLLGIAIRHAPTGNMQAAITALFNERRSRMTYQELAAAMADTVASGLSEGNWLPHTPAELLENIKF